MYSIKHTTYPTHFYVSVDGKWTEDIDHAAKFDTVSEALKFFSMHDVAHVGMHVREHLQVVKVVKRTIIPPPTQYIEGDVV